MPAIRVVDRIQDMADFKGLPSRGRILQWDYAENAFILESASSMVVTNSGTSPIVRGQCVTSGIELATNSDISHPAIGLALENIAIGDPGRIATSGDITLDDWTILTGATHLVPGTVYYLGVAGSLFLTPPVSNIQRIGSALTPTTLLLAITPIESSAINSRRVVERITLTTTDISNKFILLGQIPMPNGVQMEVLGSPSQSQGSAWAVDVVNPKKVVWGGYSLDGLLETDDVLIAVYQRNQ